MKIHASPMQSTPVSRRTLLQSLSWMAAGSLALSGQTPATRISPRHGDLGDGTYLNPIFGGDHPDAGAIRVGSDYYLTHSSFQYAPGLPVWHSRDLVSWELADYGLKRHYGDVWAPYLCEHKGTFYIYYPCDGQLFAIHAASPAGPWSDPVSLKIRGIDPAHIAAPTGERYLHFSGGRMVELAPDGLSVKTEVRTVFRPWPIPKDWRIECVCLEAPKLLFRDGYYHLIVAQGGTAGPATSHAVISARSRNVDGPWEYSPYNPIVHTRSRAERWWSQGHGRLVDAPDGSWWMTYHAYENGFRTLGRQTLLLPVEWTREGWFRIPAGVSPEKPLPKPRGAAVKVAPLSDDFRGAALASQWQFFKAFRPDEFQVGGGRLVLQGGGKPFTDGAFLTLGAPDHAYEVEVDVEISGGCEAGLVLFYTPGRASGVGVSPRGLLLRRVFEGSPVNPLREQATHATLRLMNDRNEVVAYYKIPGKDWQQVERVWDIAGINHNTLSGFLSVRPALYACGEGSATFREFRYWAL